MCSSEELLKVNITTATLILRFFKSDSCGRYELGSGCGIGNLRKEQKLQMVIRGSSIMKGKILDSPDIEKPNRRRRYQGLFQLSIMKITPETVEVITPEGIKNY